MQFRPAEILPRDSRVSAKLASTEIDQQSSKGECFELLVLRNDGLSSFSLPAKGTLSIGRAEGCDVKLDDPLASRNHALLQMHPLSLQDQGSANGTRIRGQQILPGDCVSLPVGEAFIIGHTILLVQPRRLDANAGANSRLSTPPLPVVDHEKRVAVDPAMLEIFQLLERVSQSRINLLILGETGVGKDVVAEAAHRCSARAKAPFVRINCAALAENLLESELFGYEPGAFTGTTQRAKPGLLEIAEGGTAFLDEIGELPLNLQAKLLRVIDGREVMRLGGLRARPIDIGFIFATNRDLEQEVSRGTFRSDLFFRLSGITVNVPPLRERRTEIEPLARLFVRRMSQQLALPQIPSIGDTALERLSAHNWPGNVRELRNVMERAVLLCSNARIEAEHLALKSVSSAMRAVKSDLDSNLPANNSSTLLPPAQSPEVSPKSSEQEHERVRILDALQRCHGNQSRAAELLSMPRRTLVAKLSAYDIPRPRKTPPNQSSS